MVRVALEYVKHELYQAKIMKRYGRRFVEDFGPSLERLRPGGEVTLKLDWDGLADLLNKKSRLLGLGQTFH